MRLCVKYKYSHLYYRPRSLAKQRGNALGRTRPSVSAIMPKLQSNKYLSTDYFGTRQIIFGNNMNAIGNHFYDHVL